MKRVFQKKSLTRQVILVGCLCFLLPTLVLWYIMLSSFRSTAVDTRIREAELRRSQLMTQAERTIEVCNMSTQVFLNTPALVEHLTKITNKEETDQLELLEFYREDIVSLEKIVVSNPDLYQIRVYSMEDSIYEMMPILYGGERMRRMPWAENFSPGTWYLNFDDQLFEESLVTHHVMSFVNEITTAEYGTVGILEVSARMDSVMPGLFDQDDHNWAVLLKGDGSVVAGTPQVSVEALQKIAYSEAVVQTRLNGESVLVCQAKLPEFDCTYLQVTSLSDIDRVVTQQGMMLLMGFLAILVILAMAVTVLTRKMLQGFYEAFDSIRAFANGDLSAKVQVTGKGEAAELAKEVGGLLDKIRQLMSDNVERQLQAQKAEIRALQNQINAHFIYNVLEAIKMMAEIEAQYEVADAVTSLGKLLRYSMKWDSSHVRLDAELEYIRNYVTLMNLRFDYSIGLRIEVPQELLGQPLPKISLQPIVENAVVHGAAALACDSTIVVTGTLDIDNGHYYIRITDEGKGMDEQGLARLHRQIAGAEPTRSTAGNGIGLKNVQDRLRIFFGEEYGLQVESMPGIGTTVVVTLPYREKGDEDEYHFDRRR